MGVAFPGFNQWCCISCLSRHLSEMSLVRILERPSVGKPLCMVCVGLRLLSWCSSVVFPFLVYEEAYTSLSIVGLRVVQLVAKFGEW